MKNIDKKSRHPRALYVLFFTEMWERFGFYLMVGIFLLYLKDSTTSGGVGFTPQKAADLVGTYIAMVYLTPFIGGLIADRYLGYRKAIILGGLLLAAGYFCLAIPGDKALYVSLPLLMIGNGFFKPNISTLLGNIYNREDLKPKKDVAYNIFYMGVNIGAFICNFVAALMRNHYGWGYAFAAAGVGMVISVIWFVAGLKHVKSGDVKKPMEEGDIPMRSIFLQVFLPAIMTAVLGWFIKNLLGHTLFGSQSNDAFMFACVPIIIFFVTLYVKANKEDKKGLGALFTFFIGAFVFWVIYNQNSTGLTIWADQYTSREMPQSMEKITKPFGMLETVTTTPHEVPQTDSLLRTMSDAKGNALTTTGPDLYFNNLPKDQWPPSGKLNLLSTEIFQSINPFFIVLFTPLVIGMLGWLARRGRAPNTPVKAGLGTWIAGISSLLMVFAALSTNIYHDKTSAWWVVGTYAIFTIGELFVSPVGLSMVSKLAPARLTSLMMGGWFIITSMSGKVAGLMATFWDSFENKSNYFLILVVAALIAGIIIFILSKRIAQVIKEKTGSI
ncbi:amino acid transporter [Niabella ginsenosidivorans]|uniref:Amino acid transporter n=1 Tax=Niabella ginsenosidivorans TaxID=1176587 RepID=A0A1A9I4M6_9BACT|nr:peptide MFS transporter [Niabella ginsenosidivorans]ANH82628.1 amino acid transporter [Niabella ginsenosidivorans]